jgi:hypothetical protein
MTRKPLVATLVAVALMITVAAGASITSAGTTANAHGSPNGIVGAWKQTVNRPAPLPPLRSLQVINRGGTAVETGSPSRPSRG